MTFMSAALSLFLDVSQAWLSILAQIVHSEETMPYTMVVITGVVRFVPCAFLCASATQYMAVFTHL